MTHTADDYETCVRQERAHTEGWRDYARRQIVGGYAKDVLRFYRMGWVDHETRDKCATMYARKDER